MGKKGMIVRMGKKGMRSRGRKGVPESSHSRFWIILYFNIAVAKGPCKEEVPFSGRQYVLLGPLFNAIGCCLAEADSRATGHRVDMFEIRI
jgi:hypothetical protein